MDSLNGILTKGLGASGLSLILGNFNLGYIGANVVIHNDSARAGPIVRHWPTVRPEDEQEDDKYLYIQVRLRDQTYKQTYRISNGHANILLKLNESVKNISKKTEIFVNNFISKPLKRAFKIKLKDQSNK